MFFRKALEQEAFRNTRRHKLIRNQKQQWVVVENEQKKQADLKTLSKRIEQSFSSKKKSLLSLKKKEFACEPDVVTAAKDFGKTLNYHSLTESGLTQKTF
jgi:transposase